MHMIKSKISYNSFKDDRIAISYEFVISFFQSMMKLWQNVIYIFHYLSIMWWNLQQTLVKPA